jgi:hypothetical protein
MDAKHFVEPLDLGKAVELANLITHSSSHPVQWLHMPVPAGRDDAAYFEPLAKLERRAGTELYLGLVHACDGVDGTVRRMRDGKPLCPRFRHRHGVRHRTSTNPGDGARAHCRCTLAQRKLEVPVFRFRKTKHLTQRKAPPERAARVPHRAGGRVCQPLTASALLSMRSPTVSRLYLQCAADEDLSEMAG